MLVSFSKGQSKRFKEEKEIKNNLHLIDPCFVREEKRPKKKNQREKAKNSLCRTCFAPPIFV